VSQVYNPPLQVVGFIGTRAGDEDRGPQIRLNAEEARFRLILDGELVWIYGPRRHELAPVVWITRVVMGTAVLLHVVLSIQITMENSKAKPDGYAVKRNLKASFASKNMIWTGVIIGAFIVYHLLQFTFRVTPDVADFTQQVPGNVFAMVTGALHATVTGAVYIIAMVSLFLHLSHGIQSLFQTLGLSNAVMLPRYSMTGKVASIIFLVGFGAIPVAILACFLAA
jgi:succinate dehydrogenase / fumarate reductase cytochrome b subunit